jgi:YidC/Oxa1 family membrane protein insertase
VFDFLGTIGGAIMEPLYFVTTLVLSGFHSVFGRVFGQNSGVAWALSIIGLTLVIRAALIPLFVKQIKSSRNMQLLQPRVKELQKKYGHDKERLAQEQMKLYKETGTNPLASCLPLLVQMPIFIALFRSIDRAAKGETRGVLTEHQVQSLSQAKLFGARIADTFTGAAGDAAGHVRILAAILVVAMTATTFLTQRQLMTKNMPADALTGQYAQQQKLLLYVLPVVFAISGIYFPIGVLLYWTTSNLWTMGQQFYVIRNNPTPGTPAFAAKQVREKEKGLASSGAGSTLVADGPATPVTKASERKQPSKKTRQQRKAPPSKTAPGKTVPGKTATSKTVQPPPGKPKAAKPKGTTAKPPSGATAKPPRGSTAKPPLRRDDTPPEKPAAS